VAEVPRGEWDERRVRDCMLPLDRVPQLSGNEPLAEALAELSEGPVNRGLVLENGNRLAGFLSITDLARVIETGRPRRTAA
jgi:CBS domain-containing protein